MGFFALQGLARPVFQMPELTAMAATVVAFLVFHYAVVTMILRGTPRASYRTTSDELLRLRFAGGGRAGMVAAHWCGLVVVVAIAIMLAIVTGGHERWLSEAACAAVFVFLIIGLRRLRKIPN